MKAKSVDAKLAKLGTQPHQDIYIDEFSGCCAFSIAHNFYWNQDSYGMGKRNQKTYKQYKDYVEATVLKGEDVYEDDIDDEDEADRPRCIVMPLLVALADFQVEVMEPIILGIGFKMIVCDMKNPNTSKHIRLYYREESEV